MNTTYLIQQIYKYICKPEPRITLEFRKVTDALDEFHNWSKNIDYTLTCLWSYQVPIAHPDSYWANHHLKNENYRLDIKRQPNKHNCFVYSNYSQVVPKTTLEQDLYFKLCQDMKLQAFDATLDNLVEGILQKYETIFNLLEDMLLKEDPTCQMSVDNFIFLGGFIWLQQELWLLNQCKDIYGIPINEELKELLYRINESKKLLFTFNNMVVVTGLA